MNYENRITVFLDILGFKEIIKETLDKDGNDNLEKINDLNGALEKIREFLDIDLPEGHFSKSKIVTQFSDSVVISFLHTETSEVFYTLSDIHDLLINLALRGIICRGGVAFGKLIHNEKFIYGPAMITAYETESKAAMYPRIILDKSIIKLAAENHAVHHLPTDEINALKSFITVDGDGMLYIDYIEKSQQELDDPENDMPLYIDKLKEIIETGLNKAKSPDIKVKYTWMKTKANRLIDRMKKGTYSGDLQEYYTNIKRIE